MADTYGLERAEMSDLPSALREIAEELAADSLGEAMEDFAYALEGTYLEGLDEDTIRVEFRTLLTNSAFYSLMRRCGLETEEYLEEADFSGLQTLMTYPHWLFWEMLPASLWNRYCVI